ncbi:hypothetical protein FIBSPDRAFT_938614 [Athelia psychrophila]|uniref:Transmembrane protein n=1 Tax=Athelia psychrophila TaxID=1759441 RepID=A0A165Y3Y6_9AGAM|nr:hypothetical protein FIBSPDRAFT_938614 [Fibularhizoctonia sp. CBS 109695]
MSEKLGSQHSAFSDAGSSIEHLPLLTPPLSAERPLAARRRFVSLLSDPRFQMGAILTAGVLLMGGQYGLYAHLDGRQVEGTFQIEGDFASSMRSVFRSQAAVNALGNLIANSARVLLAAAIGIAFVQVFWMYLRKREYSISQISAFMATNGSPFTLSSIATLFSPAFVLTLMALCSTAMTAITVVTPGSLTILPDQLVPNISCTVPTVDIARADFGYRAIPNLIPYVNPAIQQLVARVVVQETYFPLNSQNLTCNASCQYYVEFIAPALQCVNITDSVDFSVTLPALSAEATADGFGLVTLWNSTKEWDSGGLNITISFMQGQYFNGSWNFLPPQATRCTAYNATYGVTVLYSAAANTSTLNYAVEIHDKLFAVLPSNISNDTISEITQMACLADAFAIGLRGTITYTNNLGLIAQSTSVVQYSQITTALLSTHPLTLTVPEMMEFTSLSLLSGNFDFYDGSHSLITNQTTCMLSASVYQFERWRLLSTYGGCIGGAALCVLFGWFAVHTNEGGEALGFERLLESTRVLYGAGGSIAGDKGLPPDTKLVVTSGGHFVIAPG